jgi:hypothetical protein
MNPIDAKHDIAKQITKQVMAQTVGHFEPVELCWMQVSAPVRGLIGEHMRMRLMPRVEDSIIAQAVVLLPSGPLTLWRRAEKSKELPYE